MSKLFTIHSLHYRVSKPDKRNWCYINYLEVGNAIIIPALGIEEEHQALEQIECCFPHRNITQLRAEAIVKKGGALNGITWCCKSLD
ncbi:MAG: agmatine deiminase family protein [Phocaeicola sp.]